MNWTPSIERRKSPKALQAVEKCLPLLSQRPPAAEEPTAELLEPANELTGKLKATGRRGGRATSSEKPIFPHPSSLRAGCKSFRYTGRSLRFLDRPFCPCHVAHPLRPRQRMGSCQPGYPPGAHAHRHSASSNRSLVPLHYRIATSDSSYPLKLADHSLRSSPSPLALVCQTRDLRPSS